MPIQRQTILTPPGVNFYFHLLLIPGIILFIFANKVDASSQTTPTARECRTLYYDSFFKELEPSPCNRYFPMFTKQEIARFNKYHLNK